MTSFSPNPNFDRFYFAYLKDDPAKEPIAIGYSISGTIVDAATTTGRHRSDFEVQEYERPGTAKGFLRFSCVVVFATQRLIKRHLLFAICHLLFRSELQASYGFPLDPSSSPLSASRASCETTGAMSCNFSPSRRLINFTPIVFRPASRISPTRRRTI
jgi:hypothetical protein